MRISDSARCALGVCATVAIIAGCSGGSQSSLGSSSGVIPTQSTLSRYASHRVGKDVQTETVLYSFAGGTDGDIPDDQLINVGGTLYGTTYYGGASNNGTIFAITTSGAYSQLYSFAGGSDGAHPQCRLVNVGGTLYGTTWAGGTSNDGTVFKITTSATETVLHSFTGSDGANPIAGLTYVGGKLYGSTHLGGASSSGTIFKITTSGAEAVLHSFAGSDGALPTSELVNVSGTLYGTTNSGGASNDGTVFQITTSGAETVLHSFSGSDGIGPFNEGGLIRVGGRFMAQLVALGVRSAWARSLRSRLPAHLRISIASKAGPTAKVHMPA